MFKPTNNFSIKDKSLRSIKEGWIDKDEIRFDEPTPKSDDDVAFGSMELDVDPDEDIKADPGENVLPDKVNTTLPDIDSFKLQGRSSIIRFKEPEKEPEYVDPRLPPEKKKKLRIKRDEEDI